MTRTDITESIFRKAVFSSIVLLVLMGGFFPKEVSARIEGLDSSCDLINPNDDIHVRTDSQVRDTRTAIIAKVWSGDGFPKRLPDSVSVGTSSLPYLNTSGMTNLARVDEINVTLDQGFSTHMYLLIPAVSNNRLVVVQQGHTNTANNINGTFSLWGTGATIEYMIAQGYSVLVVAMPMTGPNTGPVASFSTTAHFNMKALESASFNSLELFLEPIAVALNYIDAHYSYKDISMLGVSGGGWTVVLYSAVDPRIKTSFVIAGSLPLALRPLPCGSASDAGDYEQGASGGMPAAFYADVASYSDLFILGSAGTGRKQIQIFNEFDPCCFAGKRFLIYKDTIAGIVSGLSGGAFDAVLDSSHTLHQISSWARTEVMSPALATPVFNNVTLTTSAVISVGGYTLNISGSSAAVQSIVVDSDNFSVTLASGSSIKISSPTLNQLSSNISSDVSSNTCTGSESSITLAYSGNDTITHIITPSSSICTSLASDSESSSGGGPISASHKASFPRHLYPGMSGADVSQLQLLLKEKGYYTYSTLTGYFGALTKAAVAAFQVTNGIESSGGMGPTTRAKILALAALSSAPTPTTAPTSAAFMRDLQLYNTGEDVRALQKYLNTRGVIVASKDAGSAGNETTYFGPATQAALIKFQSANNINPATGYLGPKTRAFMSTH